MERLRIAFVTFEFPPVTATGGIASYTRHIVALLHQEGHEIFVFSANPESTSLEIVKRQTCVNYLVPAKNDFEFRNAVAFVFEEFIQSNHIDLIESPEVGAGALMIKRKFPSIPLVVKLHSPGVLITKVSNTYQPLLTKLRFVAGAFLRGKIDLGYWSRHDKNQAADPEYQICELADIITTPSNALKNWACSFWRIPVEKIQIVPNPFYLDNELLNFQIPKKTKNIGFIGKLTILKGMYALTEAIPEMLENNPDVIIKLAGRDEFIPNEARTMRAYMEEHLNPYLSRIEFLGNLNGDQLKSFYESCSVCVFPSLWENYPTVILEAMAAGVAVAASDRGGITELVRHNKNGLLFNPLNPVDIAAKVNKLINSPDLAESFAKQARQDLIFLQGSSIVKDISLVYRKVCHRNN